MKRRTLILSLLALVSLDLQAQTADDYVNAGRNALQGHDMASLALANSNFNKALTIDVSNAPANLLAAGTRLLLLPQNPTVSQALTSIGLPQVGRDIYNWTAELPKDSNGNTIIPASANSSQVVTLYSNSVLPALAACQTNLSRITDQGFLLNLTAAETDGQDVTIDYGDVQILRALVSAGQFMGHVMSSENLGVVISHIAQLGKSDQLSFQRILSDYPSLFKLTSASEVVASLPPFTNAIAYYLGASDFLENARTPGADRLFTLSTNDMDREVEFRTNAILALQSVDHPVVFDIQGESHTVYLGAWFTGSNSARSFLPAFNGNRYVYNSMPDYTFGGLLTDTPATEIELLARQALGRPAPGIYMGEFFAMDNSFNEIDGTVAAFVRTNGLVTFIAVVTNFDGKGEFVEQSVTLKHDLNFDTNGINGNISFQNGGSISGNLNNDNGDWFGNGLDGSLVSSGDFQASAGYYTGTYSSPSQSGQLRAILAPDGQFIFIPFNGSNPSGGGAGQFDSLNHAVIDSGGGSTVRATNNPAKLQITGTFDNPTDNPPTHGTFSLSRSVSLPSDTPPFLSGLLGATNTATQGADETLTVLAGGSPPFSYQWYSNDVAIAGATGPNLVLHAVDNTFIATYSVTVQNLAGQTNDSTVLAVVAEQIVPTLAITAPKPNQKWSNDVFVVTGTAGDNAAVTNVSCRINGGDWINAAGTTSWSVAMPTPPGTNVAEAFATDSSGNHSSTGKVSFVRIAIDQLKVQMVGLGTMAPNLSNKVLIVGSANVIKVTPAPGYVFSNWVNGITLAVLTNGPTLSFTMSSNLVLQANLVTNPFVAPAGAFNGLFSATEPRQQDKSGWFTFTLKNTGSGSGSLKIGTKPYSFTSTFDLSGYASNSVKYGTNTLSLTMHLNLPQGDTITGAISNGATWGAPFTAYRQISVGAASAFTNSYTLLILGTNGDDALPEGAGSATVTVDSTGKAKILGTLADAAAINQTVPISKDGDLAFYSAAYSGLGSIYGWLKFINTNPPNYVGGVVSWIKPAQTTSKAYTNGFNFETMATGEAWTPPAAGSRALEISNSIVVFEESGILGFTNNVYLTLNNTVTNASANKLTFTFAPKSGLFSGSVTVPGTTQSILFKGAMLQDDNEGFGSFVNSNHIGSVSFGLPEILFAPALSPAPEK